MFVVGTDSEKCRRLDEFYFSTEGSEKLSPQYILAKYPEILLSTKDLNVSPFEKAISVREYSTNRGPIDIVYITDNAEILLVETKLLKNPESHRTVVAQAIDYAKAFAEESLDSLRLKLRKANVDLEIFNNQDYYESILHQNIINGNYQVLIVGDTIHPNILGMVESIQSAPHLAFTLNAVSLNPYSISNEEIVLNPSIEAKTVEVERSVISIEILNDGEVKINSSVPEKKHQGNKPRITEEIYLNNLEDDSYIDIIKELWREIENRGGTIDWGTVGFSGGFHQDNRRISLIWVYTAHFNILTDRMRRTYGISEEIYQEYLSALKESDSIYRQLIVPNKGQASFSSIDHEDFSVLVKATIHLMDKLLD
jgi:hypothetical protein